MITASSTTARILTMLSPLQLSLFFHSFVEKYALTMLCFNKGNKSQAKNKIINQFLQRWLRAKKRDSHAHNN